MAQPAAMIDDENLIQLENIKKEVEGALEFVSVDSKCVVCLSQSFEIFDIDCTDTVASGTPLHIFIRKFANIELLIGRNSAKLLCKNCLDLVNVLDKAEIEYIKLKNAFESIISKNPFHSLPQAVYLKDGDIHLGENPEDSLCMKEISEIKMEDNDREVKEGFKIVLEVETVDDNSSTMPVDDGNDGCQEEEEVGAPSQDTGTKKQKCTEGNSTNRAHVSQKDAQTQTSPNYFKTKRSYECDICNRIFHHKPNLQSHYRTHTGEKPYECNICLQQFREKPHLQRHLRTHTGEKPYECVVCQRRFINSHHLKSHLATHTDEKPYECEVCKQPFKHLASMKRHMRRHTGEKPYECSVCQRRFSNSHHLQGHLRTHGDDNPYKCDICQLEFKYLGKMKKHVKLHHGTELSSGNVSNVFMAHTLLSVEHALCSDEPETDN